MPLPPAFPLPMILTAAQWGMPGPLGAPMKLPVEDVFLHHTVTKATDDPLEDARGVARVGIARFGRASYTVMIHPHRVIFWTQTGHVGAHTMGRNSISFGIALIGDYSRDPVPDTLAFDACVALAALRSFGLVEAHPVIRPHSDVSATACPGSHAKAKVLPMLRAVAARPDWRP